MEISEMKRSAALIPYHAGTWPMLAPRELDTARESAPLSPSSSIGVIVPAHNAAHTIIKTTESLLATLREHDVIYIIENGSSDHTWRLVCEHYGNTPGVRLMQSLPANAAVARSVGVAAATAHEHVAFCDADDLWMPEKLDVIRRIIEIDNPDLLFHPMLSIGRHRLQLEGSGFKDKSLPRTPRFCWDLARYGNFLPTSGLVIRRSLMKDPAFLPELRQTQDYEAWCAATVGRANLRVAYIDAVLGIHYWMGGLSKSVETRMRNVWCIARSYVADAPISLRFATSIRTFAHIGWWLLKNRKPAALISVLSDRRDFIDRRRSVDAATQPEGLTP